MHNNTHKHSPYYVIALLCVFIQHTHTQRLKKFKGRKKEEKKVSKCLVIGWLHDSKE